MITKPEVKRREGLSRGFIKLSRNRLSLLGAISLTVFILLAIFAHWIAPYPEDVYDAVHFDSQLRPPSVKHWLGTDEAGRDILSRLLYGGRISLTMSVVALVIALSIGLPLGICAGYYGGKIEQIIMRVTDVFCTIPALVLALVISVVLSPSLTNCMLAIGLVWWRSYCLIAHGETLSIKQETFVTACKSLGTSNFHIMFFEILPNMTSTILVKLTLDAGYAILIGTAISFLGAGANPPTPEWGLMVAYGRHYLPSAWWASFFPGLAIFFTVFSFNVLGDGLRDFFDVQVE
jgi:peptide/nickel transport system permease protein